MSDETVDERQQMLANMQQMKKRQHGTKRKSTEGVKDEGPSSESSKSALKKAKSSFEMGEQEVDEWEINNALQFGVETDMAIETPEDGRKHVIQQRALMNLYATGAGQSTPNQIAGASNAGPPIAQPSSRPDDTSEAPTVASMLASFGSRACRVSVEEMVMMAKRQLSDPPTPMARFWLSPIG